MEGMTMLTREEIERVAIPAGPKIPHHWVKGRRVPHIKVEIQDHEQGQVGVIWDVPGDKIILWCHPKNEWFQRLLKDSP